MDDITLCARDACPLGHECQRHRLVTKPTPEYSWAMYGPPRAGWCDSMLKALPPSDVAKAALAVADAYGG